MVVSTAEVQGDRGLVVGDWEEAAAHQEVSRELESIPKLVISATAWITSSETVLGWMNMWQQIVV